MPPKKGPETEALPEPPPKAAVIDPAQRSSSTKDRLDSVMSRFEKFDVDGSGTSHAPSVPVCNGCASLPRL